MDGPLPGRWASIAAGASHLCAIDVDQRLFCWGDEAHGKLGGPGTGVQHPQRVGTAAWRAVAAGLDHTCALSDTGTPWCWGLDSTGQVSGTPGADAMAPQLVGLPVTAPAAFDEIAVGAQHACARAGGAIYCWGDPGAGRGAIGGSPTPTLVMGGPWRAVSTGWSHTCAIDTAGQVSCWGNNDYGQVGVAGTGTIAPTVEGISGVALRVSAGVARSCAVIGADASATTGAIWCWGGAPSVPHPAPAIEARGTDWTDVVLGNNLVCGLHGGVATCWGVSQLGGFGDGVWTEVIPATGASGAIPADAVTIGLGINGEENVCVRHASDVACWGDNRGGQLGAPRTFHGAPIAIAPPAGVTWVAVAVGSVHTCATDATGAVWCWGADDAGQVTRAPSTVDQPLPVSEPITTQPVPAKGRRLVAGIDFTCAHGVDGIDCWGTNANGELGAGDGALHANHVAGATNQGLIGGGHAACLMGPLGCWGRINGAPVRAPAGIAEDVGGLLAMTYDISFGDSASCAIANNARVCWGYGYHGQLGDGQLAGGSSPPVAPRQFTEDMYVAISLFAQHACAITKTAALRCWGTNYNFEAGTSGPGEISSPTPVVTSAAALLGNCKVVTTGSSFSCGLCGMTPWCWGANTSGELGRGPGSGRLDAVAQQVAVPPGQSWTQLGAGHTHACALSATGTLACWGLGERGQLGDGGHGSSVPVPIATP